ncbi:MAG: rhodanese-like domain-containing protein [Deltaproteobacteria bacterium]|nr:rhodanese-like domain-containing protein [Deltaproteobacteria bacterium]
MKKSATYRNIGLAIALMLLVPLACPAAGVSSIENISASASANLIAQNRDNPDFMILDIRTPSEFEAGHIAGARMLDFYSQSFVDDFKKLDRNKTYLIYCRSGSRSGRLMQAIDNLGFKKIFNMERGLKDWVGQGYALVKP